MIIEKHCKSNPRKVENEKFQQVTQFINKTNMKINEEGHIKVANYIDSFCELNSLKKKTKRYQKYGDEFEILDHLPKVMTSKKPSQQAI